MSSRSSQTCRWSCWSTKAAPAPAKSSPGPFKTTSAGQLVGTVTFGKGSVQMPHTLSDESILRVTVARWYTPDDRTIDGSGRPAQCPCRTVGGRSGSPARPAAGGSDPPPGRRSRSVARGVKQEAPVTKAK
jgi:hypothetical protein